VDPAGKPVANAVVYSISNPWQSAVVAFNVSHDSVVWWHMVDQVDVISGADGTYSLRDVPVDTKMLQRIKVTRDGYIYKSGGDISEANGKIIVSPIVMTQLGGRVDGIVYNSLGKPVANAWVFCPDCGDNAALVQTDAAGHFDLSNLIAGNVTVYAAKGLYYTHSTLKAAANPSNVSIRFPAKPAAPAGTPNLANVTAMLTQLIGSEMAKKDHLSESTMRDAAAYVIAGASPDAAVNFILSSMSINNLDLSSIVSARTDIDPRGVAGWALSLLKHIRNNDERGLAALDVGLAVAPYDAPAAEPYYHIAAQCIPLDHLDQTNQNPPLTAMRLTALAYILHRPEADADYAKVMAALDTLLKNSKGNPNTSYFSYSLGSTIAMADADKAISILCLQPASDQYATAPGIIAEVVKPNPASAMALYQWVAKQRVLPDAVGSCDVALAKVLPIIYRTDPKGAIAQAHGIADSGTSATALTDIADLMPLAQAAPLYQEAENKATDGYGNGYSPACIANHAWLRDQVLGAKLFNMANKRFITLMAGRRPFPGDGPSSLDFAFYYSHIDPAYCRFLLESHFAISNQKPYITNNCVTIVADVAAMCAIDTKRALEMAAAIKDHGLSYSAVLKVAQYLLLTPQQRNAIAFFDWANNIAVSPDFTNHTFKAAVSPTLMTQVGGKVNGVVYNGLGKPVAGAWVFSPDAGSHAAPVQTDASGQFELSNIAAGNVTLYAAKGLFYTHSTIQVPSSTSVKVTVRFPSAADEPIGPANLTKAIVMLTQNINRQTAKSGQDVGSNLRDEAAHIIAEASPDAAVRFVLSTSQISTWDLSSIVSAKTDSDPLGIASWALVPIKRMSDDNGRGSAAVNIGLAAAPYNAEAATPYYDIASQYIHFENLDQNSLLEAMKLTALAYALHRPEADNDYAKVSAGLDTLLKKSKTDPNMLGYAEWIPENLAKIIAPGNVDKAIAILSAQPLSHRYSYVTSIIAGLVKPNPSGAMALYSWVAQDTVSDYSDWAQGVALCEVLPIIYKTDPKGAVEQAHFIADLSTQARGLTEIADLMPLAEAEPLYEEAETKAAGQNGGGNSPAYIANHAWLRDKVFGAKLFNTAFSKFVAVTTDTEHVYGQGPSYSEFAFYYSRIDPAYCRILLESQFAKNIRNTNQYHGSDGAEADVAAMCAIDINRAAEMAGQIPTTDASYEAGLKPAQYLLLTQQQRYAIPFSDWADDPGWVPGTPSN
jgi:hypothetical protein